MNPALPAQLLADPELAVLEVLDHTLQQAIYALFAAHPQLVGRTGFDQLRDDTLEVWLADVIYNQGSALQHAIQRYREAIIRRQDRDSPYDEPGPRF